MSKLTPFTENLFLLIQIVRHFSTKYRDSPLYYGTVYLKYNNYCNSNIRSLQRLMIMRPFCHI